MRRVTLSALLNASAVCFTTLAAAQPYPPITNPALSAYKTSRDFGAIANTNTGAAKAANDAAAAAISAACNAGTLKGLLILEGDYYFATDNPFNLTSSLTAPGCDIGGIGPGTRLIAPSGTSITTFLTVEGGSGFYTGATFHDLTLQYNNTPTLGQAGIVLGHAADTRLYNLRWVNAGRLISVGNALYNANKVHITSWIGDFNNGASEDCIICVYNASDVHFTMGDFNGAGTSDTNTNGAMIYVKTVSGGLIDTVSWYDWIMQSTDASHGKPYGVWIDDTNGNVANLRFIGDEFDNTTTCGVLESASAAATGWIHMQDWKSVRISPTTGCGVKFDVNGGVSAERIQFEDVHLYIKDNTIPFQVLAVHDGGTTNYIADSWIGGTVIDQTGVTSVTAAFKVGAPGWLFNDPSIGRYDGGTPAFTYLYNQTDSSVPLSSFGPTAQYPSSMIFLHGVGGDTVGAFPQNGAPAGCTGLQATNTTSYYPAEGLNNTCTLTEIGTQAIASRAFTATDLPCSVDTAPSAGHTVTMTLRKNAASPASGLVCTVSGTATTGTVSGSYVSFAKGDTYDVQSVYDNGATTSRPRFSLAKVNQ